VESNEFINFELVDSLLKDIDRKAIDNNDICSLKERIRDISYRNIQLLIDSLPDYIILVDSSHNIIMTNNSVKNMGYSPEDLLGGYCPRVIHGSDSPIPECPLEEAVRSGSSKVVEFYDESNDRWFLSAVYQTPFKTKNNETIYFHQLRDITERKKSKQELKKTINKVNTILEQGIQAIVKLLEIRDPYTADHQKNVSLISKEIAINMGLPQDIIETVTIAGLLHDIGKIVVPIAILNRPTKLNKHEFNLIKLHSEEGYNILKDIDFPWPVAEAVLQHHERLDGSGYPDNLKGSEISLAAKILGVADVVDAISSHRPYRPALGIEKSLNEILKNKGLLYDDKIVDTCIILFRNKLKNMYINQS